MINLELHERGIHAYQRTAAGASRARRARGPATPAPHACAPARHACGTPRLRTRLSAHHARGPLAPASPRAEIRAQRSRRHESNWRRRPCRSGLTRWLLRLRLRQAVALILYVDGDLGQCSGVLPAMVRTEKQLS